MSHFCPLVKKYYRDEKLEAMTAWADYLERLVKPEGADALFA
jgi:hypothetical protein